MFTKKINKKIESIEKENLLGICLMGSYSRNEAGKFSDIDIVCFSKGKIRDTEVLMITGKYLAISYVQDNEVEDWFTKPELITEVLYGLTKLIPIWDTKNYLENLKKKAISFEWNNELQVKINEYVNRELTLLIEEVNKGIQGLFSKDNGRLLNSIFGLSHLLFKIICVQKKVFIKSDNTKYEQVLSIYEQYPQTVELMKKVFGEIPIKLENRVEAGLRLFKIISTEFKEEMDIKTLKMIRETNTSINWIIENKKIQQPTMRKTQ